MHHVALVAVEDKDRVDVIRSHLNIWPQDLVNPRQQHNSLIHPCGILTVVVMGCGERCKLHLCDAAIYLPLKHHDKREHHTIPNDLHHHCCPLCVVRRCADVSRLFSNDLK